MRKRWSFLSVETRQRFLHGWIMHYFLAVQEEMAGLLPTGWQGSKRRSDPGMMQSTAAGEVSKKNEADRGVLVVGSDGAVRVSLGIPPGLRKVRNVAGFERLPGEPDFWLEITGARDSA